MVDQDQTRGDGRLQMNERFKLGQAFGPRGVHDQPTSRMPPAVDGQTADAVERSTS